MSMDWKKMYESCLAENKELKEENNKLTGWLASAHENADAKVFDEAAGMIIEENDKLKEENKTLENIHSGDMKIMKMVKEKWNEEQEKNKKLKEKMTELKDQMTYLEDDNCRYANSLEEEYILKTDLEEEYVLKTTCDPNIPWFKSDYEELKDQLDIAEADLEEQANIVCEVKEENEKLKKENELLKDNQ